MHSIARMSTRVFLAALLIAMLVPATASAAPADEPKVAFVRSTIVYNGPYGSTTYSNRVNSIENLLRSEFSDVTEIGDAELQSSDPDALGQYDVIVLTRHTCMTATQRHNIRDYVARGGGIVTFFQLANWDASPDRVSAPHTYAGYKDTVSWGVPTSYMNAWRWGETSELHMTKFVNDGKMYDGYTLYGYTPSSHPILQMTADDLNRPAALSFTGYVDFNELVDLMPGVSIEGLLRYNTLTNGDSRDDYMNAKMAAWTGEYYYGRVAYYGFQLHDLCNSSNSSVRDQARRLLLNSVRWAGEQGRYGYIGKHVSHSGKAWYTRGRIYCDHTLVNDGGIQLFGQMKAQFINPSGSVVYTQTRDNMAIPAGGSYVLKSWQCGLSNPTAGTWKVRISFRYYDLMRGGWVASYRDVLLQSNGSSMTYKGNAAQVEPSTGQPAGGDMLAGATRYDTGAAIAGEAFSTGLSSERAVILASGLNFNDALASSGLAGKLDAPILLVPSTYFPSSVGDQLQTLYSGEPSATVYVIGGTSVVPDSIVDSAKAAIEAAGVPAGDIGVRRVGSGDAYSRAAAVAVETGLATSGPLADTVIVATGEKYADALSISPLAARHGVPIVYVTASTIPAATQAALTSLAPSHTIICGGGAAVNSAVESWFESNGYRVGGVADNTSDPDSRLWGASRYDTCLSIYDATVDPAFGGFAGGGLVFATGLNYPDALAGGVLSHKRDDPILLIYGTNVGLSTPVAAKIHELREAGPAPVTFLGGPAAVTDFAKGETGVGLKTNW